MCSHANVDLFNEAVDPNAMRVERNVHDYHTSQFDLGFGCIWPFTHNTGSWREGARQTGFVLLIDGETWRANVLCLLDCAMRIYCTSTDTGMPLQKAQRMENHNDHVKRLHSYLL